MPPFGLRRDPGWSVVYLVLLYANIGAWNR